MDKFFNIVSWTFYKFGKSFQYIYFKYPVLWGVLCFTLLPIILLLGYAFLGMITITNKKIKSVEKIYLMTTNSAEFYKQLGFTSNDKQTLLILNQNG